jgi:hypothetical protein
MRKQEVQQWAKPIYYAHRRLGAEADLENAVVAALPGLLRSSERPSCIFGSRTIGAGAPDLTIIYCAPGISVPPDSHPATAHILAYLRVVNQARLDTLRQRLRLEQRVLDTCLEALFQAGVLRGHGDALALESSFRQPLREIVTIEAKVSKWRDAVSQAARNRVFAHRSLVALPESQARLAIQDKRVAMLGIGVISVAGTGAKLVRRSRRSQPRVWRYYFELALASARHLRSRYAVHGPHRAGEDLVSSL